MQDANARGALLTTGEYYGTLAAARCYGRLDIPVFLAGSGNVTQTRWSRFVTETVEAPGVDDFEAFGKWLMIFGREHPGLFLYSTSDDMSWLLASRRDELAAYYRLYQPPLETIVSLLDKSKLYAVCPEVGIDAPQTLFPDSDAAVAEIASTAKMPLLIKPRTQMLLTSKAKGRLCRDASELASAYQSFRAENTYRQDIVAHDANIVWPMLQAYHPEAMTETYSLSGFIDQSGEVFEVRAARKVFQRPRRLGVGLCFLGQAVNPELRQKIFDLCRRVGYYGAFESEFVPIASTGKHLLIDFNPRFYGQMGFEVARGMPLPAFVYYAAHGYSGEKLRRAVDHQAAPAAETYHYSNRWVLRLVMLTQSLSGRLSLEERQALHSILHDPRSRYVDAVKDDNDAGPLLADVLLNLKHFARHPRDFYRKFFLDA